MNEPQQFKTAIFHHPYPKIAHRDGVVDISKLCIDYGDQDPDDIFFEGVITRIQNFLDRLYDRGYRIFVVSGDMIGINNLFAMQVQEKFMTKDRSDVALYNIRSMDTTIKLHEIEKGTLRSRCAHTMIAGDNITADLVVDTRWD